MTNPSSPDPSTRAARAAAVAGIAVVVLASCAWPLVGPLASLGLPLLTHRCRRHLWPEASTARSLTWSALAWVGLWLPALLGIVARAWAGAEGDGRLVASTQWLILPLCAPDGTAAVLLPALALTATCLVGLLGAVAARRPWPWVVAAWLAPWAHQLASSLIPHQYVC